MRVSRSTQAVVLLLAATLLAACAASAPAGPPLTQTGGTVLPARLTYCTVDGVALTMNVFPPSGPATRPPSPVAMMVHGGGWVAGDAGPAGRPDPVEAAMAAHGFFVASINYRLAPHYQWPAQIEDAKCAVRFLRSTARRLGIDPGRIGVWGGSAGGHLVSLLGLAGPSAGFDRGPYPGVSSSVQAVVDEWGPADLTGTDWGPAAAHVISQVFGEAPGQSSPALAAASPVTYIAANDPPFLIIQGAQDTTVPASQSQEFAAKLQAAGVSEKLVMVQNAGHGLRPSGGTPNPSVRTVNQLIVDFLVQQLHPGD